MHAAAAQCLLVTASLAMTCGALAQPYDTGYVTVRALHKIAPQQMGRNSGGVPVDRVELSHRISYQDLDLGSRDGVAELERRITASAQEACRQIDSLYAAEAPDSSERDCVGAAVRDALPQVQAAVADSGRSPRERSEASGE